MGLSKNAPVLVTAREREISALRFRAEGCTYEEIGRRLGVAKQSAWEAVDRAMTRSGEELRDKAAQVRALEAERLDAAAAAIWPKVMDGDLRAQDTWLRNRSRYAGLLGLDVRDAGTPMVRGSVSINVVPPWEQTGRPTLSAPHEASALPAPEAPRTAEDDGNVESR